MESQGHSILPWFCKLLPSFHLWIFRDHRSAHMLSCSTLASITHHYASSTYPRRDYKFGQILSRFLSFALPFADTNDHHGTSSYVIQSCIIVDQHPLRQELPSTSQKSSSAPIDHHTPFNNPASSVIPFISTITQHFGKHYTS